MTKSVYQAVLHLILFLERFSIKTIYHRFSLLMEYNPLVFSKIIISNNSTECIFMTFNYDEIHLVRDVEQNADLKNIRN